MRRTPTSASAAGAALEFDRGTRAYYATRIGIRAAREIEMRWSSPQRRSSPTRHGATAPLQILRAYLARLPDDGGGFLRALRDPSAKARSSLLADPGLTAPASSTI